MTAPRNFSFEQWIRNEKTAPHIDITDDLSINFDEFDESSTCDILLINKTMRRVRTLEVQYNEYALVLKSKPENDFLEPSGIAKYTFTALFYKEKTVNEQTINFHFENYKYKSILRTIRIDYTKKCSDASAIESTANRKRSVYEVPGEFLEATKQTRMPSAIIDSVESLVPAHNELTYANYGKHFHGLLYLDEIFWINVYKRLQKTDIVFRENGGWFEFDYSIVTKMELSIGDRITARKFKETTVSDGFIVDFKGSQKDIIIVVQFEPNFRTDFDMKSSYTVKFIPNRKNFIQMHKAIDIVKTTYDEDMLFPAKLEASLQPQLDVEIVDGSLFNKGNEIIPWSNPKLNPTQQMAVKSVLRFDCSNMPYIINGPPGTGKTTTVIEILLQLLANIPKCRVLVVSQSNNAADVILKRLSCTAAIDISNTIRVASINFALQSNIDTELKPYYAVVNKNQNRALGEIKLPRLSKADLASYRIVITTISTAGHFLKSPGEFSHALIDEAGQCSEMEVAIPMAIIGPSGKLVLIGDTKQTPPMCLDPLCKRLGYENSYLSRRLASCESLQDPPCQANNYDPRVATQLLYNYRSLPSILHYFNRQFYDMQLIPQVSATESRQAKLLDFICNGKILRTNPENHGIFFRNVCGERDYLNGTSPCNYSEAKEIHRFAMSLIINGFSENSIGIVTPYALQVNLIKTLLGEYENVKIGSVETFQGDERDIILLSTVRTVQADTKIDAARQLGFIKCPNRINVAASRARCLLYVFGCERILISDPNWGKLVEDCKQMGTYFGDCNECQGRPECQR